MGPAKNKYLALVASLRSTVEYLLGGFRKSLFHYRELCVGLAEICTAAQVSDTTMLNSSTTAGIKIKKCINYLQIIIFQTKNATRLGGILILLYKIKNRLFGSLPTTCFSGSA